ncbi:MAG TPA: MFS transporter [Natronosporangium sp.]|nr:MFS transporter [Natronosporangium sp.]
MSSATAIATPTGHPRRWWVLSVMVLCLLVVVLENTILNVALKVLADPEQGLAASQAELEWAVNSYTLAFAGFLFMFGVLGDRFGRRRMLQFGLLVFLVASVASAYAQDPLQLILARAAKGLGAAAIMPATLSIISHVFHPAERGRAIGIWSGAVGIAVAIGPVTGGVLLEYFWWGSIFLINVPVVLLSMGLTALLVPESRDPTPSGLDLPGVLLSVVALGALVYGIVNGGEHGFDRPEPWLWVGGGLLGLAVFVWWERRARHPSLDVRLFRDPRFATAVGVTALIFFAALGVFFFVAFYLQLVRGYSPLATGLLLLPFALAQIVFAPRSVLLVQRYGAKRICAIGLSLTTVSLLVWTVFDEHTPIWVVAASFFVQGAGMAHVMPPAMEAILACMPRERAGVGSAVANTARQVGGALGIAVLGSLIMAVYRAEITPALSGLPDPVRSEAAESIAAAYAVATRLELPDLPGLADHAFVTAMHLAAAASTVVAVVSVLVVLRWLPGRPDTAAGAPRPRAGRRPRARRLARAAADRMP